MPLMVADPPRVGDKAADFTLAQIEGKKLTLSTELKSGPVVLIVGRGWVGLSVSVLQPPVRSIF